LKWKKGYISPPQIYLNLLNQNNRFNTVSILTSIINDARLMNWKVTLAARSFFFLFFIIFVMSKKINKRMWDYETEKWRKKLKISLIKIERARTIDIFDFFKFPLNFIHFSLHKMHFLMHLIKLSFKLLVKSTIHAYSKYSLDFSCNILIFNLLMSVDFKLRYIQVCTSMIYRPQM